MIGDVVAEPTCKHGVKLDRSCFRCKRFVEVVDDAYRAGQENLNRSLRDLEAMLEPLMEEIARVKAEVDKQEQQEEPPDFRPWFKR
jgi:hypothetical protein